MGQESALVTTLKTTSVLSLACGFILATAGVSVVPALARTMAGVGCPAGTVRSEVGAYAVSSGGRRSTNWEVRCVDAGGVPHEGSKLLVMAAVFFVGLAASAALIAPAVYVTRVRAMRDEA